MHSLYLVVAVVLLLVGGTRALPCSACDYVIPTFGGTYGIVDNSDLALAPGSILCWSAANNNYGTGFFLRNFTGNASNRFVFTNCGGTAVIDTASHAIITQRCRYIRITGKYETNSTTEYGLRITRSGKGVAFETGSTYVELDHVELTNSIGHASIIAKTDPDVEGGAFTRPGFVMQDVWLHHNYIHDVDTEAFYVGYFNFEGSNAHEIHGLRLYNNIVKNTGWDGIQVGCAMSDTKVYNNYVTNYGTTNTASQNSGIILLAGFKGEVYGNKVDSGPGIGILYHGNLDSSIYNNVVLNADLGGISASINSARTNAGTYTAWHHNTIVGYGGNGLNIYITTAGHTAYERNNVIIGGGTCSNLGTGLDDSNLCATTVSAEMRFTDASNGDYSLQANSSLINQGVTCVPNAITTDWNGGSRDSMPDLGAFEFGTTPRDDSGGLAGSGSGTHSSSAANTLVPLLSMAAFLMLILVFSF